MQLSKFAVAAVALGSAGVAATDVGASPITKIVQLISDLQSKVVKEGHTAHKVYADYAEWCEDRARELTHEIKTGKDEVGSLNAKIEQETATSAELNTKVDELASGISVDENDLKAATKVRDTEAKDFAAEQAELVETISMLDRAKAILEREMAKGGSSLLQSKDVQTVTSALSVMVSASMMASADAEKLNSFIQGASTADAMEMGAPAAAVYESQSGGIVETLSDLKDKAEAQLDAARKKETESRHNFELLRQSLEDEIRFANKDMAESKKNLAASAQTKASAGGDLDVTSKDLAADVEAKSKLHQSCMTKAEDFEAEAKSRNEELSALAEAKKIIESQTGGAESFSYSYGQVSFVQQTKISSASDLRHYEMVRFVRDLAKKDGSLELAQLARRVSSAMHGRSSEDVFGKVKGLISDMIAKLEDEAAASADKKAYCDKELAETSSKDEDKSAEIAKLSSKIDVMSARSAKLKEEVSNLQAALSKLTRAQAEMDKMRAAEHEAYVVNKADLEQGLSGVKGALKVLNEYYAQSDSAHSKSEGGSTGIIGLLEVVESDFSKNLAEVVAVEETAAASHEEETKENSIENAAKGKDVEHKSKESTYLDKEVAELSADRANVQTELDAVHEYLAQIKKECTAVAESYADRKAKREAEIDGLKQALDILESEVAFVQSSASRHRRVREQSALRGAIA